MFEAGAPHADQQVWDCGVPILGICYGLQEIVYNFKGKVESSDGRQYGHAEVHVVDRGCELVEDLPASFDVRLLSYHGVFLALLGTTNSLCFYLLNRSG